MTQGGKVCLFSSYFVAEYIPAYVKRYLLELSRFFDTVLLITNDDKTLVEEDSRWLGEARIGLMLVKNEGFDFGMWQKAIKTLDLNAVERLGLVNDSCILFAPLDDFFTWFDDRHLDVGGMVESYEKTRHLQSYFLVVNRPAIAHVCQYILSHPVDVLGYDEIVATFELGLSSSLYEASQLNVAPRYRIYPPDALVNPSFVYARRLIEVGLPLVKRKLISKQGAGVALKRTLLAGESPWPEALVALIQTRYGLSSGDTSLLFQADLQRGRQQLWQFRRRLLRYAVPAWFRRTGHEQVVVKAN